EGTNIVEGQLDRSRSKVLIESGQLRGARNPNDPRLLRKQPGQCDLRRSYFPLFCEEADNIDQSLVRFAILRAEPWHAAAEVGAIELRVCVDLACQEAFAKRAKRDESNPEFFQCRHHRLFGLSPEKRVLALQRCDWLNCVRAADRLRARFGETEVLHLTFLNQVLDSARNILDRNVQVDPMLVEQIYGIDPQPLERPLCDLFDVLWPTIQRAPLASIIGVGLPSELRRDYDFPAKWSERFAYEFFVGERAVYLGGLEDRDPSLHGGVQHRSHPL